MKRLKIILGILAVIFIGFIGYLLYTNYATESGSEKVIGELTIINGNTDNMDISFRLKDDPGFYYINRGLENNLNVEELKEKLLTQQVTIYYSDHWNPLNQDGKVRHITRLEHEGNIIYTEF